ncbi:ankyrin [Neocallimastix californiae]|uniref:Ankyrin n=1 Tax=Neocallimastix californiae TaxID=1754190 RepID=A0A1Y2AE91_9FUNG|nr:ankyrin [Neocallimastix californiae]|eukprot:ORY20255.1 ankyrin [Neocallimastix californiae]
MHYAEDHSIPLNINYKIFNETSLLWAIYYKNIDMVKLIMEYSNKVNKKLEINQVSINGLCPINLAISKNCVEIVELILKYVNENEMKLIINEKDKEEFDFFLMKNDIKNFIKEKYYEYDEYNYENDNKNLDLDLINACKNNCIEEVKNLITRGAKTNISNSTGNSPLNILCKLKSDNSLEIIEYLIENGADINYKDKNDMSLILTACYFNKLSIIKYLITNNKADINTKNNNNDTLLIISVYFNNEKIIKYLIENKADFHLKNKNGYNVRTIVRNLKLEKIEKYFEKLDYLKIKNESLNDFKNNNNDRDDNNSDSDSIISSKLLIILRKKY